MAVIKGSKNSEIAKELVEYVCSVEGARYLAQKIKTIRMVNKDTNYEKTFLPSSSNIIWVNRDVPYLREHKKYILEHWNELLNKVKK